MIDVPHSVTLLFLRAGWRPQSGAGAARVLSAAALAAEIVREFGGLRVGQTEPGRDMAASDVMFYSELRPDESKLVQAWASRAGELVSFAVAHNRNIPLFVGHDGAIYAYLDADFSLYLIGRGFGEAMERLLLGHAWGDAIPEDSSGGAG